MVSLLVATALLFVSTNAIAQSPEPSTPQVPLGSGFTYQGQLKQNGTPVNKICDMAFRLYDAVTSGVQISITQTIAQTVMNGLFVAAFNNGSQLSRGHAVWKNI